MGKGVTVIRSPQRQLAPDNVGPENAEPTFLRALSIKAGTAKAHRFQNLYGCLDASLLRLAWSKLNKHGAPGVDRVTIAQYGQRLDGNIQALVERLKRGEYRSRLIRRKYIPKGNGKERPLGIPVVEDRLLQGAVRLLLEAIYENAFLPLSYGYRPGVGAQQAVRDLTYELQFGRYGHVVEADIKGFFDGLDHDWLLKMLRERVDDEPFLGLIDSWLKAGILERDGTLIHPHTGTPQGGTVSPVLANIYLHYVLDLWFERVVKARCRGQAYIIRFADDCAPRRRTGGRKSSVQPCCTRDGGRSPEAAVQAEASNHPLLLPSREVVVSELGKGWARPGQVRTVESNASEPLMRCRKRRNGVKTGGSRYPGISPGATCLLPGRRPA